MFKSLNIDSEKEDRIIRAATRVFAESGYEKASTNAIVKEAKISKGILFHYFNSKKELYVSLYEYLSDLFTEKIYEKLDWNEHDIFVTIRSVTLIKFELFSVYPDLINFLTSAFSEEAPEVKEEIEKYKTRMVESSFATLFSNIDTSKFKEGIDVNKSIQVIYWTFEGMANQQQQKAKSRSVAEINQEEVLAEIDAYIELLKISFYK
ncbi:TetR/AcrR family transcriptional regulator [Rossellomorea vietnamensis]|uniref:TetR/AcrR family transcriptional regulator n=1 Tax=Rossellomorea TaxID=2837508 RepID=UPI001CC92DE4|nr:MULTISPECIES: TetR/AcrR family transcriptional regulator [Rossellomorea]MCA0148395.1 TetR/AcrR family transcriptional regulator [Rossellomorea vietnamensis]UTE75612.1 TetR/AcrR family transcriptional regulator [Rossellomorea sp. KS-H15a]